MYSEEKNKDGVCGTGTNRRPSGALEEDMELDLGDYTQLSQGTLTNRCDLVFPAIKRETEHPGLSQR